MRGEGGMKRKERGRGREGKKEREVREGREKRRDRKEEIKGRRESGGR